MCTSSPSGSSRRDFLRGGVSLAGVSLLGACTGVAQSDQPPGSAGKSHEHGERHEEHTEAEVSPGEDLMREHGVVTRILLVYDEAVRRLSTDPGQLAPEPLKQSAELVRDFVEDYHERLEERYLFPRFRKAGALVELVDTLQNQHNAGRRVTDVVLHLSTRNAFNDDAERLALIGALRQFVRMYLPHESREDTVLFPAFRKLVSANEYYALGEEFEDQEHERFGQDGFQSAVDKIAAIEKQLGIYNLAQFTPQVG